MDLVKTSACRRGVIRDFALCKSYYPGLDLDKLVQGFPELKADGSRYRKTDYAQVAKTVRHYATKIADEINLQGFEPGYDECNKKHPMPMPEAKEPSWVASRKRPSPLSKPMRTMSVGIAYDQKAESAAQGAPQV